MKVLDAERFTKIRAFIDEYYLDHHKSPTVRDIAAGTGISKTAVQRYLTDMKAHGEIEYNGRRSIETDLSRVMTDITPAARYDSTHEKNTDHNADDDTDGLIDIELGFGIGNGGLRLAVNLVALVVDGFLRAIEEVFGFVEHDFYPFVFEKMILFFVVRKKENGFASAD